jgi:hypothetical protein
MSWPASRRAFATREWANRNADIAGLWRALMQWQNYTYDADLAITPADPKLYRADPDYERPFKWMGYAQTAPLTSGSIATVYVPPPRSPGMQILRVWLYCACADGHSARVDITNERTRVTTSADVTTAALGGTSGWMSLDVSVQPHDMLRIDLVGSGGWVDVHGVSSYWMAPATPGVEFGQVLSAITRGHYVTAYRPDSAYVARWLGLAANRFMAHRSRMQVASSWLHQWAYGNLRDGMLGDDPTHWTVLPAAVGRYRVLIGEGVSKLRFALLMKSYDGGAGSYVTADVKVGGVSIGSTTNSPTSAYTWREFSIAITPTAAAREAEIVLVPTSTLDPDHGIWVASACAWEEEATIALVGAESLPGAFAANADEAVGGGRAMTAAQRAQLVDNMLWLWANRGLRCLVNDCRHDASQARGTGAAEAEPRHLLNGDAEQSGEYRFRFLGANRVPRFTIYTHSWAALNGAYDGEADYVWVDETSQKAQLATRSRITGQPAYAVAPRVTRTGNFPALSAGTVSVAAWQTALATLTSQSERLSGLIIEEAPLHEQAGTRS